MTISTLALNSAGTPFGVHRDHQYQQAVRGIEELQQSRKILNVKVIMSKHKESDVGSGRRAGEVGGLRDGDVRGAGADGDTTQEKRSKAAVMFSHDEENSFTTYAKSRSELTKRKITIRKRKDEEKDDNDDDENDEKEQQKGTKQLKKSFKTFSKRVNVKFPKMELPKFDGTVTEWMSFRYFFGNAVHRNSSLSKIDKFTYLKAQVQTTTVRGGFWKNNSGTSRGKQIL